MKKQCSILAVGWLLLGMVAMTGGVYGGQGSTTPVPSHLFAMGATGATQAGLVFNDEHFGSRFSWYITAIQRRIAANWQQSTIDPALPSAPRAVVAFDILRNGAITNIQITQSSNNYYIDESARRTIAKSSPLMALPPAYVGSRVSVEFYLDYRSQVAPQPQDAARADWPKQPGTYIVSSSDTIPSFARQLSGYRSEAGQDFWGKPFSTTGTLRIFQGNGWQGIPKFPNTMNGCSSGYFMIRWRSASADIPLQTSVRYSPNVATNATVKTGAFGYMSGTNCEQPMFNLINAPKSNGSALIDIYYELKFWQAAP